MRSEPHRWPHVRIDELVSRGALEINDGYRAKNSELGDVGLPFARAGNVRSGITFADADILSEESVAKAGAKVSEPDDVVFTSKGTVGRFAYVTRGTPRFVYSPQLCFWRVRDREVLRPRYVYFWMHGSECRTQFQALKGQTDMADYISLRDQRTIEISLPSVAEQEAIASVLGALDDKIDGNDGLIRLLGDLSGAQFDELQRTAAETIELGRLVEVIDCLHSRKPEQQPVGKFLLQLNNLREDGLVDVGPQFLISETDYANWTRRMELRVGDCVITNVGRVGAVARVPDMNAALGRNMTGLRCRPEWPFPSVLVEALLSSRMRQAIDVLTDSGTVMNALNVRNIPKLPIPALEPEAFAEAESRLAPFWLLREGLLRESRALAAIRDELLPKLVSGQIRVPDSTDPAETIEPLVEEHAA